MSFNSVISLLVVLFSFLITAITLRLIIPPLKSRAKQPIYTEGPSWHKAKEGTPTMGGLAFLVGISICLSLCVVFLLQVRERNSALALLYALIYCLINSLVGITDDLCKLQRKKNAGLSPLQKLVLQIASSVGFIIVLSHSGIVSTELKFAFGAVDIGWFYYPIALVFLVGITNCANLTDGIDGLAGSIAATIGAVLLLIFRASAVTPSVIGAALFGGSLAFLIYNIHPAKIFMGDTGSLLLGSLVASVGIILGNPFILLLFGGVYVIEGVSVILQVLVYKLSGKRLFKMAPIHHHLEKCGFDECKICMCASLLTLALSVLASILFT